MASQYTGSVKSLTHSTYPQCAICQGVASVVFLGCGCMLLCSDCYSREKKVCGNHCFGCGTESVPGPIHLDVSNLVCSWPECVKLRKTLIDPCFCYKFCETHAGQMKRCENCSGGIKRIFPLKFKESSSIGGLGSPLGSPEGTPLGSEDGSDDGTPDGTHDGGREASLDGCPLGSPLGSPEEGPRRSTRKRKLCNYKE